MSLRKWLVRGVVFVLIGGLASAGVMYHRWTNPALELEDVHLIMVNDPLTTVTFEGTGKSAVAGNVSIRGTWQRATDDATLSIDAKGVPVGPSLLRRLAAYRPELTEQAGQLTGIA